MKASALDCIGQTPLIALDRLYQGPGRLLAKAEFTNPGGSIKDRAARRIIQDARATGRLRPGQPVVEMTSGNMGAGLAVVCGVLGHPFTAVMSKGNSPARAAMMRGFGAQVELVDQVDGSPGQVTGADIGAATEHAIGLAKASQAFYVDQFNAPGSVAAHRDTTGPEIWEQTRGAIRAFVAAVGSAGTFVGCSQFLKQQQAAIHCVAVEPAGARVLAGQPVANPRHALQGIGYGFVPPSWNANLADALVGVSDDDATLMRQQLAEREGLYVGFSAGANVHAAVRLLQSGRLGDEAMVVTVLCDTGLKY